MIITTLQMGFWGSEEESIGDKQVERKKKKRNGWKAQKEGLRLWERRLYQYRKLKWAREVMPFSSLGHWWLVTSITRMVTCDLSTGLFLIPKHAFSTKFQVWPWDEKWMNMGKFSLWSFASVDVCEFVALASIAWLYPQVLALLWIGQGRETT